MSKPKSWRFTDPDVRALYAATQALYRSTSRRTLEANMRFLWDHMIAHPSRNLPAHLRVPAVSTRTP